MFKNLNIRYLGISGRQSELIELALSYRFKGMDLDVVEFAEQVATYGLPHARRLIDSARIQIGSFRLPIVWEQWEVNDDNYKAALAKLPELAQMAASLGCTRCLMVVAPASDQRPYHENFEYYRKRISEIADVLKPHGIRLGLEFLAHPSHRQGRAFQFIHSLDALVMLAKSTACDNVGVVLDVWQIRASGASLDEAKKLSAKQIVTAVLSDMPTDVEPKDLTEDQQLLPGETGAIDSVAVLQMLAEMGFQGPVTPKASSASLKGKNRDAIVKLAAQRLDQFFADAGLTVAGKLATGGVK